MVADDLEEREEKAGELVSLARGAPKRGECVHTGAASTASAARESREMQDPATPTTDRGARWGAMGHQASSGWRTTSNDAAQWGTTVGKDRPDAEALDLPRWPMARSRSWRRFRSCSQLPRSLRRPWRRGWGRHTCGLSRG
jgi:hypothetical protein